MKFKNAAAKLGGECSEKSAIGRNINKKEATFPKVTPHVRLRRLDTISGEEIDRRRKTYFKFLVVRPFERLLSGYRDKFLRPEGVPKTFTEYVPYIKKQRKGANNNVTFSNFVDYIYIYIFF